MYSMQVFVRTKTKKVCELFYCSMLNKSILPVVDPVFEIKRELGFILLAQPAFLPSVIFSFFHPK